MSVLLKIDIELSDYFSNPFNRESYVAVKKTNYIFPGNKIMIYKETNEYAGLIGIGEITDYAKKVSEIPSNKQNTIYDRSLFQVPVRFKILFTSDLLNKDFFYKLPALNERRKIRAYNSNTIYFANWLDRELNYIFNDNWWYFTFRVTPTESHYRYWLHYIREYNLRWLEFNKYKKIITGKDTCSICKIKHNPYSEFFSDFFEMHEIIDNYDDKEYRKIKPQNFIVVCPNCHKKEHEKIKNIG
ncbi:MAG: hypothetical protein ACLFVR_05645 [Thiohalospira sp.]